MESSSFAIDGVSVVSVFFLSTPSIAKFQAWPFSLAFPTGKDQYSAVILEDGNLFTWGSNGHGRQAVRTQFVGNCQPCT